MSDTQNKTFPKGSLTWFEIPTGDIARAAEFFRAVLAAPLIEASHDEPMLLLPMHGGEVGGALVQRAEMKPGPDGPIVYLRVDGTLADAMGRVSAAGGVLLTPALTVPNAPGTFCLLRDTEGNRIGLHAAA